MGIQIGSTIGYLKLDSWVMASIIQLATDTFCGRHLSPKIDPCHRLYDQMTQAARSVTANIAEGSSRHQTSRETEMRLLDVARASLAELSGDYLHLLMRYNTTAWRVDDPNGQAIRSIKLDPPQYGTNLLHDATAHVNSQRSKFAPWLEHADMLFAANALIVASSRLISMLRHQIAALLETFKAEGGFTENLTAERYEAKKRQQADAPRCPVCGAAMVMRVAKKGQNSGKKFWSCSNYHTTGCQGTRRID